VAGRSRQNINVTAKLRRSAARFGPAQGELARTFCLITTYLKSLGTANQYATIRVSEHDARPTELSPIGVTKGQQTKMQATWRGYFNRSRPIGIIGR
jgi:hypothetical protein